MNIDAECFTIKMTHGDLWSTAFDVRYAIIDTIKTHWIKHQDRWKENEAERLNRCRAMFFALGRPDLYEEIFIQADQIFKVHNEK